MTEPSNTRAKGGKKLIRNTEVQEDDAKMMLTSIVRYYCRKMLDTQAKKKERNGKETHH